MLKREHLTRSMDALEGVHPHLAMVTALAMRDAPYAFVVTEGLRSLERQRLLVAAKKSWTLESKHLDGHAIDVAIFIDGEVTWAFDRYQRLSATFKAAAASLGVPLVWGGDWRQRDGVHFELDIH